VTLGNLVGGFFFTGFAIFTTYRPAKPAESARMTAHVAAE
jgi:formate/nitrite transporter FocA (FNT family)